MSAPEQFRYPSRAVMKDYAQAATGALIFGAPLILAGGNIYVATIFGAIVLMFVTFGWSTWRRHRSVICVTDEGIWSEGARTAALRWTDVRQIELRYFATRRGRGRSERDGGDSWMQLKLTGDRVAIRIDSSIEGFDRLARRIGRAAQEFDLGATPTTKVNFAAIGAAPDPSWAKQA